MSNKINTLVQDQIKKKNLFFIAGPCVIESESILRQVAEKIVALREKTGLLFIFKSSYEKANRTSGSSYSGPGIDKGLKLLAKIKHEFDLPVVTDVHRESDIALVKEVADVIQIPAFLSRQSSLLQASGASGCITNIKKAQFMAPADAEHAVTKVNGPCWLTERGSCFGYNRLIVDFTGFYTMRTFNIPLIFDATHSVQQPGAAGATSGGNRQHAKGLARCATAIGFDGLFFEVHPQPDSALCDGPNSLHLSDLEEVITTLVSIKHSATIN